MKKILSFLLVLLALTIFVKSYSQEDYLVSTDETLEFLIDGEFDQPDTSLEIKKEDKVINFKLSNNPNINIPEIDENWKISLIDSIARDATQSITNEISMLEMNTYENKINFLKDYFGYENYDINNAVYLHNKLVSNIYMWTSFIAFLLIIIGVILNTKPFTALDLGGVLKFSVFILVLCFLIGLGVYFASTKSNSDYHAIKAITDLFG